VAAQNAVFTARGVEEHGRVRRGQPSAATVTIDAKPTRSINS
jgi:hypothetical protein